MPETIGSDNIAVRPIILTGFLGSATVHRAISAGAMAFLGEVSMDEITDAILRVARRGTVISPIAQRRLDDASRSQRTGLRSTPTPREIDILTRAADGGISQDIVAELHISGATVNTHRQQSYEKLGVSDRAYAVAQAIRRRLL